MGGKGNSGPQSSNDAIVAMQMQQAAQATEANRERTARLNYGKGAITSMFEGTPSGATPLDLSGITQGNAPGGGPDLSAALNWAYSHPADASMVPGLQAMEVGPKKSLSQGYSWGQMPDDGSGTTRYGIYDPSGNLVDTGSLSDLAAAKIYTGGDPSKTTGGFDDAFYNKYRQSILDYYNPQESDQYAQARSDLSASLARAGQLNSSTAGLDIAKLAKQDTLNRAQIASSADTQTGTLRSQIQQDEQSALNQLYSTEDPTVAANTAGNMVANAQLTKPLLNPAGALFSTINVGVGNALSGFLNPTAYINPGATNMGMASTPSGSQSSGSTQSSV